MLSVVRKFFNTDREDLTLRMLKYKVTVVNTHT